MFPLLPGVFETFLLSFLLRGDSLDFRHVNCLLGSEGLDLVHGEQRGGRCLIRIEIIANLQDITQLLEKSDTVVRVRCSDHGLERCLELERIAKQIKNEGQVQIGQVDKVLLLLIKRRHEVELELPTVIPGVVDVGGNLLRSVQHGLRPIESLDH